MWPRTSRTSKSGHGVGLSSWSGRTARITSAPVDAAAAKSGRGSVSRANGAGVGVCCVHEPMLRPKSGHLLTGSPGMMEQVRADRLVAVLMLLQTRGRVTAAEVAAELEISERTARRDLDALAMAGLPVYSQPGRNGGWELLGGARTDLSGLNAAEARALFLVAGPSPASPELKAALRKLVRALPEPFRADAQAASTAVVVDPNDWGRATPTAPAAAASRRVATRGDRRRTGRARLRARATARRRRAIVHPLGLAAKGAVGISSPTPRRGCARSASTA